MKSRDISILILILAGCLCDRGYGSPIVYNNHQSMTLNGKAGFAAFKDFDYLKIPQGIHFEDWRINQAILQGSNTEGSWINVMPLPTNVSGAGKLHVNSLGAPGIGKGRFVIAPIADQKLNPIVQFVSKDIIEVGSEYVDSGTYRQIDKFTVFSRAEGEAKAHVLSSFLINHGNPGMLTDYLADIVPLSSNVIGIIVATQIPGMHFIIFYDLSKKEPTGITTFSKCQYLPFDKALWIVPALPFHYRGNEFYDALKEAEKAAKTIPIWKDGIINPEFKPEKDALIPVP